MNARIILLIFCLLGLVSGCQSNVKNKNSTNKSLNVTIYSVDKNDYNCTNVTRSILSQAAANTTYKTMVLIYDGDKNIAKWGSHEEKVLSDSELRKIVDEAVKEIKVADSFDGILGLHWGMMLETAISELKQLGLTSWMQLNDNAIMCTHKTAWMGVVYNTVVLGYYTSNKQNKYLYQVGFNKLYKRFNEAEVAIEDIAQTLSLKYGEDAVRKGIKGDNSYIVFSKYDVAEVSRIELLLERMDSDFPYEAMLVLIYNDLGEASMLVEKDNN